MGDVAAAMQVANRQTTDIALKVAAAAAAAAADAAESVA